MWRKKGKNFFKFNGEAQGTYYSVSCYMEDSINLKPQLDSLLKRFDSSVSTYKPNSIISRLNNNDTTARADEIFRKVFLRAMEVSSATNGAFDITVGPLVNAWGFGFGSRLKIDRHIVDSLLPLVGYSRVKLSGDKMLKADSRIRIDFNAIAQGYAVDVLSDFLKSKGITDYLVDIGGEVFAHGTKKDHSRWTVGIEKPSAQAGDEPEVQALVDLQDHAISTSGNYRKYFEEDGIRYSHTIDPATGYPVRHALLSVSVLASDCMTADAYATAFMVMGLEKACSFLDKQEELEAYFIYSDPKGIMKIYATPGFDSILRKDSPK